MIIDEDHMCTQTRDDMKAFYLPEPGRSCPTEILETLAKFNAEGRPIWKPMHMQPIYKDHAFITADGGARNVGTDIFERGLCLPSDNKMRPEQQVEIIEIIRRCFKA
jgi:dTDP-4-amino-4,6-dideoxygalactose transaminase